MEDAGSSRSSGRRFRAFNSSTSSREPSADSERANMAQPSDNAPAELPPENSPSTGCGKEAEPLRELEQLRQRVLEAERRATDAERKMEWSERERRWIALEIHDGLAQELAGATMFIDVAQAQLPPEASATRASLAEVGQLIRSALAEARRLMEGIRPPILESEGLGPALRQLAEQQRERHAMPLEIELKLSSQRFLPTIEMAAFRIVQEGLTNVQRHSQATRVRLAVVQHDEQLRIQLEDNGKGFDPERIPNDRYGMRGMRERAELAEGRAVIDSAPGQGTRITVELPLHDRLLQVPPAIHADREST